MVNGATPILNGRVTVCDCAGLPESVTLKAGYTLPSAVGVPVTAPVVAFSDRPAGNVLPPASDHVYGNVPPVALTVAE
jgi:hypothetical protein